jgi:hypothetical protein
VQDRGMSEPHRKKRPITIYSVSALLVLLIGGGITVVGSILHLDRWMESGDAVPVGRPGQVNLPSGECVVFFESTLALPSIRDAIDLIVTDPAGEYVDANWIEIDPEEDYAPRTFLAFTSRQGRPLWRFNAPVEGLYTLRVTNMHDDQDPEGDRIVVGKSPPSFKQAQQLNNTLKFGGLSVTGALFVLGYLMHLITLNRQARAAGAEDEPVDA